MLKRKSDRIMSIEESESQTNQRQKKVKLNKELPSEKIKTEKSTPINAHPKSKPVKYDRCLKNIAKKMGKGSQGDSEQDLKKKNEEWEEVKQDTNKGKKKVQKKGILQAEGFEDNKTSLLHKRDKLNVNQWDLTSEIVYLIESQSSTLIEDIIANIKDDMVKYFEFKREILSSEDLRMSYASIMYHGILKMDFIWKDLLNDHLRFYVGDGLTCDPLRNVFRNSRCSRLRESIVMSTYCPEDLNNNEYLFRPFIVFTTNGIDESYGIKEIDDAIRIDEQDRTIFMRQYLKALRDISGREEFYGVHIEPESITVVILKGEEFWESQPIPADLIKEFVQNKYKKTSEEWKFVIKLLVALMMKSLEVGKRVCRHNNVNKDL